MRNANSLHSFHMRLLRLQFLGSLTSHWLFSTYVRNSAYKRLDLCAVVLVEWAAFFGFTFLQRNPLPKRLGVSILYGVLQSSQVGESSSLGLQMAQQVGECKKVKSAFQKKTLSNIPIQSITWVCFNLIADFTFRQNYLNQICHICWSVEAT